MICLFFLLIGCNTNSNENNRVTSSKSWAYDFVVWDGKIYKKTNESVHDIGGEIGVIEFYYEIEGTYQGNFSNKYSKGSKLFSINSIDTQEAIAIEVSRGVFEKLQFDGIYQK